MQKIFVHATSLNSSFPEVDALPNLVFRREIKNWFSELIPRLPNTYKIRPAFAFSIEVELMFTDIEIHEQFSLWIWKLYYSIFKYYSTLYFIVLSWLPYHLCEHILNLSLTYFLYTPIKCIQHSNWHFATQLKVVQLLRQISWIRLMND